ncbi:hypothetical protein [Halobellus ordinarius]|uniref:hypothetical protein n=1 Tax=Halobellus ordinarius TaxID=3075120 RepID=UPI00288043A1|nr:hypothetical protein [Halobellus sp. ZY16]
MQLTRSTLCTLVVLALVVTAGCQGLYGSSAPPSDQQAVDAVTQAQEASGNVTAYRVSIDGQVEISDDSRSESVNLTGDGLVNVDRQQANVTIGAVGDTRVGLRDTRMAYVDGYTLTTECSRLGWARYNLSDSTRWFNYTPLGQQLTLLDRTNVYWNGTERVNGVETAVVTAYPTEDQLQANQNLPTGNVGTQGSATLDNATVRVWISTETHRVRKVQREIHVRGDGATGVATITFRFTDYNEPTNITRPTFEESGTEWKSGCPDT